MSSFQPLQLRHQQLEIFRELQVHAGGGNQQPAFCVFEPSPCSARSTLRATCSNDLAPWQTPDDPLALVLHALAHRGFEDRLNKLPVGTIAK